MADKALNRILQIMKEPGLTPGHRVGVVKSVTPESLAMEAFLRGHDAKSALILVAHCKVSYLRSATTR